MYCKHVIRAIIPRSKRADGLKNEAAIDTDPFSLTKRSVPDTLAKPLPDMSNSTYPTDTPFKHSSDYKSMYWRGRGCKSNAKPGSRLHKALLCTAFYPSMSTSPPQSIDLLQSIDQAAPRFVVPQC